MRKCKDCGGNTTTVSMESADDLEIHVHYVCLRDPNHASYCTDTKKYIR